MPEHMIRGERVNSSTSSKANEKTFGQRKEEIQKRLQHRAEQCRLNYSGRKELATECDEGVAELCEALEDAFSYGLRQPQAATITAVNLFQNMQEIVTGYVGCSTSDATFWDFCQQHLTLHERERYMNLKHIWTKYGRGKAFIRAALNEDSLQRYLLTWLSAQDQLQIYYSPWSLLLDAEVSRDLVQIVGSLNQVLFALTVDTTELNVRETRILNPVVRKEEPVIHAPSPIPVASVKHKRRINAIERPITSTNSTEDLIACLTIQENIPKCSHTVAASLEFDPHIKDEFKMPPRDPIEPELEFLKQPLPEVYAAVSAVTNGYGADAPGFNSEDKSDTSSQYSKSSSIFSSSHANDSSSNAVLEEKLREMNERCALLETRVAQLSLENRQLVRRLTHHFKESGIQPSSSLTINYLITIPHAKLLKSQRGGSAYYSYEIHITMRKNLEHWLLQKRYSEFYKLHKSLLKTHPSVSVIEFPPKKHFGNMNLMFVEERRQQLQIYLLNLVEMLPQVEACKSKAELTKMFPFFREL